MFFRNLILRVTNFYRSNLKIRMDLMFESIMRVLKMGGERVVWEYHTVTLARVTGYGFGIAVSGGKDNPHFASGDPAIAISDVLKAGPAEGKLQISDRLVSANGISLENVDYTRAVQVLRECGNTVNLVIKRKKSTSNGVNSSQSVKVTLTKSKKKDDFGIILGCRIYVKEVTNHSGVQKDGALHEGDIVLKINTNSTDCMTLKEARKLIENTKEKLQLVIKREPGNVQSLNANEHHALNNDSTSSPSNSLDAPGITRTQWNNQNLYVQPPTRGDAKLLPPTCDRAEDKNNLTRLQSGRNRGPIMDISLSQLDQPATPLLTGHSHSRAPVGLDDEEPLQRPSLPRIDEYAGRRDQFDDDPLARRNKVPMPDPRFISFQKDGSVGIRLTGGNEVGIFVTAVQPGSPASLQGLQPGDKILKVNDMDMRGVTREDAVLFLLNIQDFVNLIVQHHKEEYDEIVANQRGDSFYIRTHFSYEGSGKGELGFHVGEVFHVIDTLHNGVVGSWVVYRLGRSNQEIQKGIIPNRSRAEQWAQEQHNQAKKDAASENRGSFFKRRSARRSKSLSKDHWEDVVFADGISKFPAYERVTLKHQAGFIRPVVLFGSLADVARDKLLKDFPDKYASPQLDGHLDDTPKSQKPSGIIRLSAIKEIIEKGKHAILDITPSAVDRLNYAQFCPIVIFMRAENKHTVKELRSRLAKSSHKSSKKLYDHAVKLEKLWSHIFTATITLTSADMWYKKLRETIDKQQQQSIWISESKPEEAISDDFLFPMTSRLSYASSPESDLELATETRASGLQDLVPTGSDRHLVKASSDPSIATQEEMNGPPGYNQLPGYSVSRGRQLPFEFLQHQDPPPTSDVRDSLNGNKFSTTGEPLSKNRAPLQPEPPPRVDRNNKPTHYRNAQERFFSHGRHSLLIEGRDQREPPDYINTSAQPHTLDRLNGRAGAFDSSSYSSDSYNQYSTTNLNDMKGRRDHYTAASSGQNNRQSHDPYRYTRSTAQPPIKNMNIDNRNRIQSSSKYGRHQEERTTPPSPPPKPSNYQSRMVDGRPVPPPKPGHYQSRGWRMEDDLSPSGIGHPPQHHDFPHNRSQEGMPPPYTPNQRNRDSMDFMGSPPYYTPRNYASGEMLLPPPAKHSPPPPIPDENHDGYRNQPLNSPTRRQYKIENDNSGFDSGRGSSLDRNYDVRSYPKPLGNQPSWQNVHVNGSGPYHNVPFRGPPRREPIYPPPYDHHSSPPPPPTSLLDLSNRENRGSAFELYKKPDSRSPMGMPQIADRSK